MATWVLSECGTTPLPPKIILSPRTTRSGTFISNSARNSNNNKNSNSASRINILNVHKRALDLKFPTFSIGCSGRSRNWVPRVSAPLNVAFLGHEKRGEHGEKINSGEQEEVEFDPGAQPPFRLGDIRGAIPKHCWVKDPWKSMSYVIRDVVLVFGLAAAAAYLNSWLVWPLYWVAQGTMFWALFVLGHDW